MQESREVFTKSVLTFYIEATRHALPAANLPQFVNCVLAIERFRDFPNPDTHEGMVEQYEMLRWNERSYTRAFTAAKECYAGLPSILEKAVDGFDSVNLSDVFAFQEAKWYTARALCADPYDAQRTEDAWQNALFEEVFPDLNARTATAPDRVARLLPQSTPQRCRSCLPRFYIETVSPERADVLQIVAFGPSPGERPGQGPIHLQSRSLHLCF